MMDLEESLSSAVDACSPIPPHNPLPLSVAKGVAVAADRVLGAVPRLEDAGAGNVELATATWVDLELEVCERLPDKAADAA